MGLRHCQRFTTKIDLISRTAKVITKEIKGRFIQYDF